MSGTLRTAAVWVGCIAPTAVLNVLPHGEVILAGPASAGVIVPHATMMVIKVSIVVGAAYLLIAAELAETKAVSRMCVIVWAFLASVCLMHAMEGAGRLRDGLAAPLRGTMQAAAGLDSRLAAARNSRSQLPHFTPASPAMEKTAAEAVATAQKSREDECLKRGPFCRDRETAEAAARVKLAEIQERVGLTGVAERLDDDIAAMERERAQSVVPVHADPAAARVAMLFSKARVFGPVSEADVTEAWPIWLSIVIEIWATLGSYCFLPRPKKKQVEPGPIKEEARPDPVPEPPSEAEETGSEPKVPTVVPIKRTAGPRAGVRESSPASPAKSRKPKVSKASVYGPVREFYATAVVVREGAEVRPGVAYDAYVDWCRGRDLVPVNLTTFGTTMKKELGVAYTERSRRGYYQGIALASPPKLSIVSSKT